MDNETNLPQTRIYTYASAVIKLQRGVAARTASLIVTECTKYKGEIYFQKGTQEVGLGKIYERADCKNIMEVMMLAAGPGAEIDIFVEGSDNEARRMALRLKSGLETVTEGYEPNFERYSELK